MKLKQFKMTTKYPCHNKRHIQATQLVRLESMPRSCFPKDCGYGWSWNYWHNKNETFYYGDNHLSKKLGRKPLAGDRAFYPHNDDIHNHISTAKRALQLSKYDQENLHLKIEEWKKENPQSSFFFCPFHSPSQSGQVTDAVKTCDERTSAFSRKTGRNNC